MNNPPTVLLLNASNMESHPVYPYAFIQVPAIARRGGIRVVCQDLLGIPEVDWQATIQGLIERHQPAMILITLRNTDSYTPEEYGAGQGGYYPIERTRALIQAIRATSKLKIAMGGFAFSLLPEALMDYLRPDFGVVGGPDDFFAKFEAIQHGELEDIANLVFFRGERLVSNRRVLYPPLAEAEYTPQAIREMMDFYTAFPKPGFQGAAVEVVRGCSQRCVFCAEPHSVGSTVRYRDIRAIMKDVATLVEHGITKLYMISSELNPEGNEFTLQVADQLLAFNASQVEGRKVTWFGANYLLTFNAAEYERLYRSGFTGGWFDITALDDDNARAMRTPYRNERLIPHLKAYAATARRQAQAKGNDESQYWTMFLGNPATTLETIRNTLQTASREGLAELFDRCSIINKIRVFDYEEPSEATLAATHAFTPEGKRTGYQQLLPSYALPPALLQHFSEAEVQALFTHIQETYLSSKYRKTRDWAGFLQHNTTPEKLRRWAAALPVPDVPEEAWGDDPGPQAKQAAQKTVEGLVSACLGAFPELFEALSLPSEASAYDPMLPYELAVMAYRRWQSEEALSEVARSVFPEWKGELLIFCLRALLYRYNVVLEPRYKAMFIED